MLISFLLKQLYCCYLEIRFFSLILIGILVIHFSYMFFYFLRIDIQRIVLKLLNVVSNLVLLRITPNIKQIQFDCIHCIFFFFAVDMYLSHWKLLIKPRILESLAKLCNILDKTWTILETDLVSLKAVGGKKQCNKWNNHVNLY